MTETTKFRCSRCRCTRNVDEAEIVIRRWDTGRAVRETEIKLCSKCRGQRQRAPICPLCCSLAHRVQGKLCRRCGLAYHEEEAPRALG